MRRSETPYAPSRVARSPPCTSPTRRGTTADMPPAAQPWRNLEQRVAQYFEQNGYSATTNHREQGRSGLVHEIDVLAEKRDAAGTHRVVIECKAWRSAIEKDVVYKLERVMQDAGLSKGIIVCAGGLRSGARIAA